MVPKTHEYRWARYAGLVVSSTLAEANRYNPDCNLLLVVLTARRGQVKVRTPQPAT